MSRNLQKNYKGIFAIFKPKGITSHDVIDQLRKITKIRKIGHAGTLDPMAKGVLIVGIGKKATKKLSKLMKKEKEYLAKIELGKISSTDDQEGEIKKVKVKEKPDLSKIKKILKKFEGKILQIPPLFSAVKIKGKKAYELAREGKKFKLKGKKVKVKKIEILEYKWPHLKLKLITGPGFYVRAFARDLGRELKTGAYLKELERKRVGEYTDKKALTIKEFAKLWAREHQKEEDLK